MDIGALLLFLALLLAVAVFVMRPFLKPESFDPQQRLADEVVDHRHSALLAEKDRLLTALAELDFDNRLKKIPEEDYPEMRAELVTSTAEVMRQLDDMDGHPAVSPSPDEGQPDEFEQEIERLLAQRRKKTAEPAKAGFCPKCGKPVIAADKFCVSCGSRL